MSDSTRDGGRLAALAGLFTAAVAIGTLIFGVTRYLDEQRLDRELRLDSQIRLHLDRLVEVPSDDSHSIARSLYILTDLTTLVSGDPKRGVLVTDVLVELVTKGLDFGRLRDVRFDLLSLEKWPDYRLHLEANPARNEFILYRYTQALRSVRAQDPEYFESIRYEPGVGYRVERFTDESRYLLFDGLVRGFLAHYELLAPDADERARARERFSIALENSELATALLGSPVASGRQPQSR